MMKNEFRISGCSKCCLTSLKFFGSATAIRSPVSVDTYLDVSAAPTPQEPEIIEKSPVWAVQHDAAMENARRIRSKSLPKINMTT
jgi:hypothetical protein